MQNTNSVVLSGRATKNAEVKTISDKCTKYSFSLAVNESYKKGEEWVEETSFFDIEAINRKIFEKEIKGQQMIIEGRLKQDRWKSDDGRSMSRIKVVVENVEFIFSGKKENDTPASAPSDASNNPVDIPF